MLTGDDIREARQKAGLSQEELASRVGVSLRSIGNYERSATVPRSALPRLQEVLGLGSVAVSAFAGVSDAQLLAEIARRFERGREGGGGHADAAPASSLPASVEGGRLPSVSNREEVQGLAGEVGSLGAGDGDVDQY